MRYVATPMHRADGTFTHRAFDDAPHLAERPGRRTASIRGLGVPFIAGWAQTPDIACAAFEHALAQLPGEWTSRRWEAGGHFLCIGVSPHVTLDGVAPETEEAARGMGMTGMQRLLQIELPLAFPVILTGIRIVLVQNIGLATVAALIGGGGFGVFVFQGVGQTAMDLVLLGAVPTVALAFAAGAILDAVVEMVSYRGQAA